MELKRVVGQESAKNSLAKFEGIQSSLVIEGPLGSGKGFLAKEFAEEVTEPELVRVFRSGERVNVGDARELVRWVQVKSFSDSPKMVVVEDAHRQSELVLNIFLKAVEEGFGRWIFTTESCDLLLDTIVSRCFKVRTGYFKEEELFRIAKSWRYLNSDSEEASKKARGSVKYLYEFLEGELADVEEVANSLLDASRNRKVGRLFRELANFRGERSRKTAQAVLDYILDLAVAEKWESSELLKIVDASNRMKVGESPFMMMSNLFIKLKV